MRTATLIKCEAVENERDYIRTKLAEFKGDVILYV